MLDRSLIIQRILGKHLDLGYICHRVLCRSLHILLLYYCHVKEFQIILVLDWLILNIFTVPPSWCCYCLYQWLVNNLLHVYMLSHENVCINYFSIKHMRVLCNNRLCTNVVLKQDQCIVCFMWSIMIGYHWLYCLKSSYVYDLVVYVLAVTLVHQSVNVLIDQFMNEWFSMIHFILGLSLFITIVENSWLRTMSSMSTLNFLSEMEYDTSTTVQSGISFLVAIISTVCSVVWKFKACLVLCQATDHRLVLLTCLLPPFCIWSLSWFVYRDYQSSCTSKVRNKISQNA